MFHMLLSYELHEKQGLMEIHFIYGGEKLSVLPYMNP
jgi:hypothetical protein